MTRPYPARSSDVRWLLDLKLAIDERLKESDTDAPSFRDEYGNSGHHEHVFGLAAQRDTRRPALSAAAHDDQVDGVGLGERIDRCRHASAFHQHQMQVDAGGIE